MASTETQSIPLFQVLAGNTVRGTGDPEQQQRFFNEVQYVEYYAKRIGESLGMRSLDVGMVEDAESQTAFCYAPGTGGQGVVVNGFVTKTRRPLSKLIAILRDEQQG
jgi:hypothetical protein